MKKKINRLIRVLSLAYTLNNVNKETPILDRYYLIKKSIISANIK